MQIQWRPDLYSIILGILIGVGLAILALRLKPRVRRQYDRGRVWVEGRISWMRSSVDLRFQAEMAAYAQKQHQGRQWADLTDIFVPPRLTAPQPVSQDYLNGRPGEDMGRIWPELAARMGMPCPPTVSLAQLLRNGRRVIITGQPGGGKSTLLAFLAHRLATAPVDDSDEVELIPIYIHLAELPHTEAKMEEAAEPLAPLITALQNRSSPLTASGIGDMLRRRLAADQIVVLLDGWGELPAARRIPFRTWIRQFLKTYPQTPFFATANDDGYGDFLHLGFVHTALVSWRLGDVQSLIEKWSMVFGLMEEDRPSPEGWWQPGKTPLAASLQIWQLMRLGPETKDVEEEVEGETDANAPAIQYDLPELLPLFMSGKKNQPPAAPEADILQFWQELVGTAVSRGELALPPADYEAKGATLATDEEGNVVKAIANRYRHSFSRCSLFIEWADGTIGWRTTWWRDYLTANYLEGIDNQEIVAEHRRDPQWQGIMQRYVQLIDPKEMISPLLAEAEASPSAEALFVAAHWLSPQESGKWRKDVMIRLGQLARSSNQARILRLRAISLMAASGDKDLFQYFCHILEGEDPFLRQAALAAMPMMEGEDVLPLISRSLADEEVTVRETAVYSLAQLPIDPLSEKEIVLALIDDDEDAAFLMAECLAAQGGPGLEILKDAVEDKDIQVRRAAVHGLTYVDEDWVEPLLVELELYDDEWFVRSAATGALEKIRQRRVKELWRPVRITDQSWLRERGYASGRRLPAGQEGVRFITQILAEAEDEETKIAAANLLARLPAEAAIPALVETLEDERLVVREAALTAYCALNRIYGRPS